MKCIGSLARGALLALCALIGTSALAQGTQSTTFLVQTTVASTCVILAGPLTFGAYAGAQIDSTSTITVTCTNGSAARILLDEGPNKASGSTAAAPQRRMSDGATPTAHYLTYQLYSDNAGGTVWDNVTGKTSTGSGIAQGLTVYGRLPGGQLGAPVGSYTDTITATISF
jgi:spore coat protein U-like protein